MGIWDTVKSGVLVKQSRVLKKWEPRWFVLQSSPPVLFYFKTASDNVPLGEIPLVGCTVLTLFLFLFLLFEKNSHQNLCRFQGKTHK